MKMTVSQAEAARICECSVEALDGYRVRTMPAARRAGLADDEFRAEEVVAIYVAVGLEQIGRRQGEIDAFVAGLLQRFPLGRDWVVETGARRRLSVVSRSEVGLDRRRRAGRWLTPRGAYLALEALGG